jgi:hypothetical protein
MELVNLKPLLKGCSTKEVQYVMCPRPLRLNEQLNVVNSINYHYFSTKSGAFVPSWYVKKISSL